MSTVVGKHFGLSLPRQVIAHGRLPAVVTRTAPPASERPKRAQGSGRRQSSSLPQVLGVGERVGGVGVDLEREFVAEAFAYCAHRRDVPARLTRNSGKGIWEVSHGVPPEAASVWSAARSATVSPGTRHHS
ncbi:hypothetical protein GCM10027072_64100 [Streptomyces bullii]